MALRNRRQHGLAFGLFDGTHIWHEPLSVHIASHDTGGFRSYYSVALLMAQAHSLYLLTGHNNLLLDETTQIHDDINGGSHKSDRRGAVVAKMRAHELYE